ncbi:hypothetical protein [Achromobacter aloeverae]
MFIVERDHFAAIQQRLRDEFPELDEGAIRHASNKITNEIRRGRFDVWNIDVSHGPMDGDGQYVHFEVEASVVTVHVRVTTD